MVRICDQCGLVTTDVDAERCPRDGSSLSIPRPGARQAVDDLVGTLVGGRFRVTELLGRGGMGIVYGAIQESLGRQVALKMIGGHLTATAIRRFLREAQVTTLLRNVHTVTVYDFGATPDGLLFLAMERLHGVPLDVLLTGHGRLPWRRALRIAAHIAESLAEAHAAGIVHRDLKPANVFIVPMGDDPDFAKVLDFGIARLEASAFDTADGTTSPGIVGTPCYMSPEQAMGQALDGRSDLYSLGVVLYEMLSGRPPFAGGGPKAVLRCHLAVEPPPLADVAPRGEVPESVAALVRSLLAKNAADRPSTAEDVLETLRRLLVTPAPAPTPRPWRLVAVAGGAAVAVAAAAVWALGEGSSKSDPLAGLHVDGPGQTAAAPAVRDGAKAPEISRDISGVPPLAPPAPKTATELEREVPSDPPALSTVRASRPAEAPLPVAAGRSDTPPVPLAIGGAPPSGGSAPARIVRFDSVPPRARVLANGRELGRTPFELAAEAAPTSVIFRLDGYQDVTAPVAPGLVRASLRRRPRADGGLAPLDAEALRNAAKAPRQGQGE